MQATMKMSGKLLPRAAVLIVVALAAVLFAGRSELRIGSTADVTTLQVTREGVYPAFQTTIRDPARVSSFYQAAQALIKIPPGGGCNPGPRLIYHLTYLNGNAVVARMEIYPHGYTEDAAGHVYTGLLANGCGFLLIEPDDERALTLDFLVQAAHLFGLPKISPLQP
jgi:hypothetical protein